MEQFKRCMDQRMTHSRVTGNVQMAKYKYDDDDDDGDDEMLTKWKTRT